MPNRRISPRRLLHARFAAPREDVLDAMLEASNRLQGRETAADVLLDATAAPSRDLGLDLEFLSWLMIHDRKVRSIAVVSQQVEECTPRVKQLSAMSGKTIELFADEDAALEWLASVPWADPGE